MLRKHSLHFLITITHLSIMFAAWYGQRPRPRCLAVATRGISPRDFGTIIKTRFLPNKARRQYPAALKIQHKQGPSKTIQDNKSQPSKQSVAHRCRYNPPAFFPSACSNIPSIRLTPAIRRRPSARTYKIHSFAKFERRLEVCSQACCTTH